MTTGKKVEKKEKKVKKKMKMEKVEGRRRSSGNNSNSNISLSAHIATLNLNCGYVGHGIVSDEYIREIKKKNGTHSLTRPSIETLALMEMLVQSSSLITMVQLFSTTKSICSGGIVGQGQAGYWCRQTMKTGSPRRMKKNVVISRKVVEEL
ncbi:hypothetical protein RFI_12795 [Reticulomyxa filosa]|uniref:Uncharacterized protein n=1 Tax=Reticulomyxa filosa TaxID=46433 RepID=X6NGB5_RETFI|nr:hypothetical protein RFI_12795 [Reticulomyxa filosa]|eukprot:ETO24362.1 hypothetical protein RFI_12795 [Reticulomyxa filosa]